MVDLVSENRANIDLIDLNPEAILRCMEVKMEEQQNEGDSESESMNLKDSESMRAVESDENSESETDEVFYEDASIYSMADVMKSNRYMLQL